VAAESMKIGANALIWTTHFSERDFPILGRLKQAGFDGIEIPVFHPVDVPTQRIRQALDENGLECTVCAILPKPLRPISTEKKVRDETQAHLRACIEVTAELGSGLMGGPIYAQIGDLPGRRRNLDEWHWAADAFENLGPTLDVHRVELAIEPLNRFETYFLNTIADAASLCDLVQHPRVGILLDTFHTNIEEKDDAAAVRTAGKRLFHVHACENDRGIPGTGHVNFFEIAKALNEIRYQGWITIESFGYTHPELAAAAAIWRDLAPLPESVAFEGIKHLRRTIASVGHARLGNS
jgi:D-psicose/D-tagatose/L-ribulose 3-epimerase